MERGEAMLKKKTLFFYNKGYNCSQCLLKAAEEVYGVIISKQGVDMCSAINTGFGIGGICSIIVSAVMLFGIMFDEESAKRLRIKLLNEFYAQHKSLNCIKLKGEGVNGCTEVIGNTADIVEKLINEEIMKK